MGLTVLILMTTTMITRTEMEHRKYNTGDEVWIEIVDGKEVVRKLVTHNGIVWSEEKGYEKQPSRNEDS